MSTYSDPDEHELWLINCSIQEFKQFCMEEKVRCLLSWLVRK